MGREAPTPADRALLAVVSGPIGHLVGTVLEIAAVSAAALRSRVRSRFPNVDRPRR